MHLEIQIADDNLYGAMHRCCEILKRVVAFKKAVFWGYVR